MNKAVVLLSGGLDSTTCLAMAAAQGFACHALSFAYGQRHEAELAAAQRIARAFKVVEHRTVSIDISQFGGSALTDERLSVPEHQPGTAIPITYVPARNTIFLAIALGYAETLQARDIFIGVSAVDYSNYPDCRPEYIKAFQALAQLATKSGVENNPVFLHTPLIHLSKAQTIAAGMELGLDYSMTVSCYQATIQGEACGRCSSCSLRRQGFLEAQITDPTIYKLN